jgi:hypothetical protein
LLCRELAQQLGNAIPLHSIHVVTIVSR